MALKTKGVQDHKKGRGVYRSSSQRAAAVWNSGELGVAGWWNFCVGQATDGADIVHACADMAGCQETIHRGLCFTFAILDLLFHAGVTKGSPETGFLTLMAVLDRQSACSSTYREDSVYIARYSQ
jgi:hypothetical protein